MTDYRRIFHPGGCYFFTVNCAQRHDCRILTDNIELLRAAMRTVMRRYPFHVDAMVVLPDHLHCIWTLCPHDRDFATRWARIKAEFSRALPTREERSASRLKRGERGIWQRRYWEHLIRDEMDLRRHIDYIHWNPVKHGWVSRVRDWPYSSFHRFADRGVYPVDWAGGEPHGLQGGE